MTGGYDGLIVVWNTDSGAISAHLAPPSLSHTGLQERSVEQVCLQPSLCLQPSCCLQPSLCVQQLQALHSVCCRDSAVAQWHVKHQCCIQICMHRKWSIAGYRLVRLSLFAGTAGALPSVSQTFRLCKTLLPKSCTSIEQPRADLGEGALAWSYFRHSGLSEPHPRTVPEDQSCLQPIFSLVPAGRLCWQETAICVGSSECGRLPAAVECEAGAVGG